MAVGDQGDVAVRGEGPFDDPLAPGGHLGAGLAVGADAVPDRPFRNALPDLRGGDAFVIPVVPLMQIVVGLHVVEPEEFSGSTGPGERAREHQ